MVAEAQYPEIEKSILCRVRNRSGESQEAANVLLKRLQVQL